MSRFLAIVVLLIIVSACVNKIDGEVPSYSKEDASAAMDNVFVCARNNIEKLDDGISDEQLIAAALSQRCGSEYEQGLKVYCLAKKQDKKQTSMCMDKLRTREQKIETFLPTVLTYRADLRKKER